MRQRLSVVWAPMSIWMRAWVRGSMAVKGVQARFGTVVGCVRAVALWEWMRGLIPVGEERWRSTQADGMAFLTMILK